MGRNNTSSDSSDGYLFEDENLSDYFGIKSNSSEDYENIDEFSKFNFDTEKTEEIKEESNITSEKINKIPTTFEWDYGGNNVYVSGSFCNWNQFFLMKKNEKGSFFLTIELPKGYHQYKFKVDDEWKYNQKFPTTYDNSGNINNYLNTTNWEITVKNTEEGTTVNSSIITDNNMSKISKKFFGKNRNSFILKMNKYSEYIPKKEELSEKIPELPGHYKNMMNINILTNQSNIGNEQFLKIRENNILSDNFSFKDIINIHQEKINHLKTNSINNNHMNDKKNIIYSVSSRFRLKYTTFVYYNSQKNAKKEF